MMKKPASVKQVMPGRLSSIIKSKSCIFAIFEKSEAGNRFYTNRE